MTSRQRPNRQQRISISQQTLDTIAAGSYIHGSKTHNLGELISSSEKNTVLYPHGSMKLTEWSRNDREKRDIQTKIEILECTTVEAIQSLSSSAALLIGVLNFASAKNPGGGFLSGAEAQEESLARSSTLYPSLITPTATQFYKSHQSNNRGGFYSHAIIYSPNVIVFRDDYGGYLSLPVQVAMVTSPAVNAGVVRKKNEGTNMETEIEVAMRDRMGRILRVFEERGDRVLILGSFGTGVFRNDVKMVASIWADLLARPGARFGQSFDRIAFAIYGRETYTQFKKAFEARAIEPLPQE